jgi:CTD kinase subunit gamma
VYKADYIIQNNLNNRANIMYFVEHLCDVAVRESHPSFVQMIQRDIHSIIDSVAPADGAGAANAKVTRRVGHAPDQFYILMEY